MRLGGSKYAWLSLLLLVASICSSDNDLLQEREQIHRSRAELPTGNAGSADCLYQVVRHDDIGPQPGDEAAFLTSVPYYIATPI